MARIAFIGAGSLGFTRALARDLLTFERLRDAELVLMDIDRERLEFARRAVQSIVDRGEYPATVRATMSFTRAARQSMTARRAPPVGGKMSRSQPEAHHVCHSSTGPGDVVAPRFMMRSKPYFRIRLLRQSSPFQVRI